MPEKILSIHQNHHHQPDCVTVSKSPLHKAPVHQSTETVRKNKKNKNPSSPIMPAAWNFTNLWQKSCYRVILKRRLYYRTYFACSLKFHKFSTKNSSLNGLLKRQNLPQSSQDDHLPFPLVNLQSTNATNWIQYNISVYICIRKFT